AEAVKEQKIREAEGEAEAILNVQKAVADSIKLINEAAPEDGYITLKKLEAFEKAADGKATKIIVPSELSGIAGLASGIKSIVEKDENKTVE
ncbi:MAG: peptidase, partial [Clostridia bacterium]|nr:peptidase [Clostridia bacterium]